jgi:hypothetical protein
MGVHQVWGRSKSLATEDTDPERKEAKTKAYLRIGHFFSNYALLFGLPDLVPILAEKTVQVQGTDEYKNLLKSVQHFLNLGQGVDAIKLLEFQSDAQAQNMKLGLLVALAVVSQKSGFVRSFYHYLGILDSIDQLDESLKFRIALLRLKMDCQIGDWSEAIKTYLYLIGSTQFKTASPEEKTSIMRRSLLFRTGDRIDPTEFDISEAACDVTHMHAENKTSLFKSIAESYSLSSPIDNPIVLKFSQTLSTLRANFFDQTSDSLDYFQTNAEKCAIACLFLESGIDMQAESHRIRAQGFKKLLLAHTMNVRNGGAETSETFGEILQSFKTTGIRDWISLAMRRDTQGRSIFKTSILTKHPESFEKIGECYGVFSAKGKDKEIAIMKGFPVEQ